MTRYLIKEEIITLLNLGKPVEAFLGRKSEDEEIITWVSLEKNKENRIVLNIYEIYDEGSIDSTDIYDFSYVDPDLEYQTREFADLEDVIKFLKEKFNMNESNFLTKGGIQDEYKKLLLTEGG